MCSSNTKNALLGLVDKNGRPLYVETLAAGEPDRLLGHPVIIDDNMPDIGAGNTALLFGDMKAYKARIVSGIQIQVYDESKYSEQGCVGMQPFVTADGRPVVEAGAIEPIAGLKF
jgi:HK97 family phage major capsid protein